MDGLELEKQDTRKKKIRVILALGIPAMLENILQTTVGFVDTLFVSKIGLDEVTAVGVANAILAVYIAVFMAVGVGASSLIARSIGQEDVKRAQDVARQATWVSVALGILFGILSIFFAKYLLQVMGADDEILDQSILYFKIVAIPSIFMVLTFTFGSILRAYGDTKTPLKVSAWANIIHIGLDYVLILGIGQFEGFGIAGAAIATLLTRIFNTFVLFYYIKKSPLAFKLFATAKEGVLKALLKLATPTAIERLIMRLGQVLYFALIVKLGTETYAAHNIAGSIESFTYMPGYGMAIAATTLVGASIGAKKLKDAREYGMLSTIITVIIMSIGGVLLFFFSPWMATWFTNDKTAIDMIVVALRIDAFAQPALAIGLVLAGALQGLGNTKAPMYSTAIGMWGVRIIGVYVFSIYNNMGIAGVWLAIAIDLYTRAIFLSWRFRKDTLKLPDEKDKDKIKKSKPI